MILFDLSYGGEYKEQKRKVPKTKNSIFFAYHSIEPFIPLLWCEIEKFYFIVSYVMYILAGTELLGDQGGPWPPLTLPKKTNDKSRFG